MPICVMFYILLEIIPAYKNDGEESDSGNYRPICLFPILHKIFESFVNDRISKLFFGRQYDFRDFRSTADPLKVLSELIYDSLEVGSETKVWTITQAERIWC